jgi:hypothetical protein
MGISLPGSSDKNYHDDTVGSLYGDYQFLTLEDIVKTFMATYVGIGKICQNIRTADVSFHAGRAVQEFSYDVFKSYLSKEIEVPNTLQMALPRDYVSYTKVTVVDENGIQRPIGHIDITSNPTRSITDNNGNNLYDETGALLKESDSTSWKNFKDASSETRISRDIDDATDYFPEISASGRRYGADTRYLSGNGWFYISETKGKVYFSSDLSGETIVLNYISDGLGADASGGIPSGSAIVHKFAEEAMYKHILYACLSAMTQTSPALLARIKKERFAETRNAKLRLSNMKLRELTQALREGSKWIKH